MLLDVFDSIIKARRVDVQALVQKVTSKAGGNDM